MSLGRVCSWHNNDSWQIRSKQKWRSPEMCGHQNMKFKLATTEIEFLIFSTLRIDSKFSIDKGMAYSSPFNGSTEIVSSTTRPLVSLK